MDHLEQKDYNYVSPKRICPGTSASGGDSRELDTVGASAAGWVAPRHAPEVAKLFWQVAEFAVDGALSVTYRLARLGVA